MGNPQTQKADNHPPRRHRLRLQRLHPKLPNLQLPGHLLRRQSQRQDRNPLRPPRRLRPLPQPADHAPHARPALLPVTQGSQRLVAVCVRHRRPRRAVQRRPAFPRRGGRERDVDGGDGRKGEV
ncbi:hypothetical protein LINPERPRIM_LOCUS26832 [Linum perenne]